MDTRDQIANICWIIEKAREFQKNIYFCFIDYAKAFDCVDHIKLWKILQEMGIPDHLTCLLRNLYAGQEATVRTERGPTDWFQIEKGIRQGFILLPCLFTLYAEYIMLKHTIGVCPIIIQVMCPFFPAPRKCTNITGRPHCCQLLHLPFAIFPDLTQAPGW